MTWLEETIEALKNIGGSGHVQDIYKYILENTLRELKPTWKSSVRKSLEINSSDSKAFGGKFDIFQTVNGINHGFWKLREEISTPWAADRDELDDKVPAKILSSIYRFQRDSEMIKELKRLYGNKCQVCGLSIQLKNQSYSEGHHLKPLGKNHSGSDTKNNIIILCPNHHVEFDYGMIGIDQHLKIKHTDPTNLLIGNNLILKHELSSLHINYHLENIYDQ